MTKLDKTFVAPLQRSPVKGGWTYVKMTDSVAFFGTRGRVKVIGTIDGHPLRTSFMAVGDGTHMLPVTAALQAAVAKSPGDTVTVHLHERLDR